MVLIKPKKEKDSGKYHKGRKKKKIILFSSSSNYFKTKEIFFPSSYIPVRCMGYFEIKKQVKGEGVGKKRINREGRQSDGKMQQLTRLLNESLRRDKEPFSEGSSALNE